MSNGIETTSNGPVEAKDEIEKDPWLEMAEGDDDDDDDDDEEFVENAEEYDDDDDDEDEDEEN